MNSTRQRWRGAASGLTSRRHYTVRPPETLVGAARPRSFDERASSGVAPASDALRCLTPRQLEVLALMAQGCSNVAIARQLYISAKAVVQHPSQIYDRLDLVADDDDTHRRVSAVLRYLLPQPVA